VPFAAGRSVKYPARKLSLVTGNNVDFAIGEVACNYADVKVADRPAPDGRGLFSIAVIEMTKKSAAVIQSARSDFPFGSLQRSDNGQYRVLTGGSLRVEDEHKRVNRRVKPKVLAWEV